MSFYLRQSVVHGQVHVSHRGRRHLIRRLQQRGPRAKAVASRPLRLRSHTGTSPGPRQVVALKNIRTVEEWPDCCVIVNVCCTQGEWHIKRSGRFKLDPHRSGIPCNTTRVTSSPGCTSDARAWAEARLQQHQLAKMTTGASHGRARHDQSRTSRRRVA